jgi:hypothetical protein
MTLTSDDVPSPFASLVPEWSRRAYSRIKFDWHPSRGVGLAMPGRYWVTQVTVRETFKLFWLAARQLESARTHSAEGLVRTAEWADRPRGERIAMGRCFKYFSLHGILPITLANPEAPYNFKYRLNDDLEQAPTLH